MASKKKSTAKSKAKLGKSNTTGYLGVTRSKANPNRFIAQYKGKKVGRFDDAVSAAKARDEKAFEVDGDKAILNFPRK